MGLDFVLHARQPGPFADRVFPDDQELQVVDHGKAAAIIGMPEKALSNLGCIDGVDPGVLEILCQFFNVQHNAVRRIDNDRQIRF